MFELALLAAMMGVGAFVVARKPTTLPTPPGGQRVVELDDSISDADRDSVLHAILYVQNPLQLDALAATMNAKSLPCASYELSYRAWELRGASGPPPARPLNCAGGGVAGPTPALSVPGVPADVAAQACALLDTSLDTATCSAVLTALATENDPSKLDAFAQSLAQTHPKAAGALAAKAQALRGQGPLAQAVQAAAASQAAQAASAASAASAVGACPGLDENITAAQCAEIVSTLAPAMIDSTVVAQIAQKYPASTYPLAAQAFAAKLALLGQTAAPTEQSGALVGAPVYMKPEIPDRQPMEPAIAAAAALSPQYEGATAHTEGAPAALAETAAAQAAGAVGVPVAQAGDATSAQPPGNAGRPAGYWHLVVRPQDTPWPGVVTKIGTGSKNPEALGELYKLNPHLWTHPGSGVVASLKPGDEVNVPGAWKDNLIRKGFKLRSPQG
jgi:hypothetical protein